MNIRGTFHIKTLFVKFFLSYILLLTIITALISMLLFDRFSASFITQINEISQKTLIQAQNSVEYIFDQAVQICSQVSFNNDVIQQMNVDERDPVIDIRVFKYINDIKYINDSIYSICIYNGKNSTFLTTDYPNTEEKTIEFLKSFNIKNYLQIVPRKLELISPERTEQSVYSIFYYNRTKETDSIENAIIVNIKEESIRRNVNIKSGKSANILVVDRDGKIVSAWNEKEFLKDYSHEAYIRKIILSENDIRDFADVINGEKTLINHSFSRKLGWHFIYIIPYREAARGIYNLRNMVILICVAVLILSLVLSAIISGKLSSPLTRLVRNIAKMENKSGNAGIDEMEFLCSHYSNVLKKIESLELIKEDSYHRLKEEYIREILMGSRFPEEQDRLEYKLNVNLFDFKGLNVNIIKIDTLIDLRNIDPGEITKEINKKIRLAVCSMSMEFIRERFPCEAIEIDGNIAMIANIDSLNEFNSSFLELMRKLQEEVRLSLDTSVTIAVGILVDSWSRINESYRNARELSNYRIIYGRGSVLTNENVFSNIKYDFDYAYNKEKALLESIRLGREDQIGHAVDGIFKSLKNYSYDFIMLSLNHLIFSVFITLETSVNYNSGDILANFNRAVSRIRQLETLNQIKTWFVNYICFEMQKIKENRKNANPALMADIAEFIENNYQNPDISIEMVSERFNYNHIYFGKLFKELFNKTFLEYITNLKIEKSIKYLEENRLTVKQISSKVGFNNPTYFVTWFKKNMGVSPSEYRQKLLNKKLEGI